MKFATLGHLLLSTDIKKFPKTWNNKNLIISPEIDVNGGKGYIICLKLTAKQMMNLPRDIVRQKILDALIFAQDELKVNLVQLGALTTSVTDGGKWLINQKDYNGFLNHGDSYTAAVTCQVVNKTLKLLNKSSSDSILAIIGAYGIIGEAVSKLLVPQFKHSILIGRKKEKFKKLEEYLQGSYEITTHLKTKNADIIITATSHPTALLKSEHLKRNAIIIDVSQPVNLSYKICKIRPDIIRIDGGYVNFPENIRIPGMPSGKNFACVAEVIMQTLENEQKNHVGSINIKHLYKTEIWAKKYNFTLNELTNFGKPINIFKQKY